MTNPDFKTLTDKFQEHSLLKLQNAMTPETPLTQQKFVHLYREQS